MVCCVWYWFLWNISLWWIAHPEICSILLNYIQKLMLGAFLSLALSFFAASLPLRPPISLSDKFCNYPAHAYSQLIVEVQNYRCTYCIYKFVYVFHVISKCGTFLLGTGAMWTDYSRVIVLLCLFREFLFWSFFMWLSLHQGLILCFRSCQPVLFHVVLPAALKFVVFGISSLSRTTWVKNLTRWESDFC